VTRRRSCSGSLTRAAFTTTAVDRAGGTGPTIAIRPCGSAGAPVRG
jgi:hypothetical protein